MKKLFTLLLVFGLLFGLVACVDDEPDQKDDEQDQKGNEEEDDANKDPEDEEPTLEEKIQEKINKILNELTIEEKIGQMFIVGFPGTTVPNSLKDAVKNNKFGNFIYFGENVADDSKVPLMSDTLQDLVMDEVGIPALITMDHEGGMVVRFAENATHYPGNMGLVATGNPNNAYEVGKKSGQELRHFGVNTNLAPVLDVNNNPQNPVIGVRSFSDLPEVVSKYGLKLIEGYRESKVLTTAKHFPGHGDTTVDSHYGLPLIPHSKDRLYEIELAPFIDAIEAGVDSIMSAHIIFSAFDDELPATLSHKVLTELLRDELGFDGIIMTDEMRMQAIRSNFEVGEAAIMAIEAGADMLLYAESTSTSLEAYAGVLKAVKDGDISEERINESVRRILEKKYKYELFDDYKSRLDLDEDQLAANKQFSKDIVRSSITLANGSVNWFSKNKSTLLISTKSTRHPLLPGYTINTNQNSFAVVGKKYLEDAGVSQVGSQVIGTSLSTNEINTIVNLAKNYDQVVVAVENVTASQANLVNKLAAEKTNILVVALRNPYDYLSYNNVHHYVCTYGYYSDAVFSVFDLMLGKYTAKGKLPVTVEGLN